MPRATSTHFESIDKTLSPRLLSSLDWRVWFLGYGLGGCCGLCLGAGAWSLLVDDDHKLGLIAMAISLSHAALLGVFWSKRSTMLAKSAQTTCLLVGGCGTALVALLMIMGHSRIPAPVALLGLATLNFSRGITSYFTSYFAAEGKISIGFKSSSKPTSEDVLSG